MYRHETPFISPHDPLVTPQINPIGRHVLLRVCSAGLVYNPQNATADMVAGHHYCIFSLRNNVYVAHRKKVYRSGGKKSEELMSIRKAE